MDIANDTTAKSKSKDSNQEIINANSTESDRESVDGKSSVTSERFDNIVPTLKYNLIDSNHFL